MKKGFTLIELLIVVAIIAILAAIAVPNFLEAQVRSKVSRVKSDIRSFATGIESYYVDNNQYPVSARTGRLIGSTENVNGYVNNTTAELKDTSTFSARPAGAGQIATLTTPIAYLTSYFPDPFADTKGATFDYFNDTNGWIMWSPGPDTDQQARTDLSGTGHSVETLYTSTVSQPSLTLIVYAGGSGGECVTYDPTNGTVSPGDVYRVKQ